MGRPLTRRRFLGLRSSSDDSVWLSWELLSDAAGSRLELLEPPYLNCSRLDLKDFDRLEGAVELLLSEDLRDRPLVLWLWAALKEVRVIEAALPEFIAERKLFSGMLEDEANVARAGEAMMGLESRQMMRGAVLLAARCLGGVVGSMESSL